MQTFITLGAVLVLGVAVAEMRASPAQPQPSPSAAQQEVLRVVTVIDEAWTKRDPATIAPLIVDDFQAWSHSGTRRTKADLLKSVATSEDDETEIHDRQVRVYGNTAVYTARIIDRGKHKDGVSFTVTTCVTTTFARIDGKWMMVADHETVLP